jgi:hypothetical protein
MLANPTNSLIYTIERPRLAHAVLAHLETLKRSPSLDKLNYFQSAIQALLTNSISRVADHAFKEGAAAVDMSPDKTIELLVRRESIARAIQAAKWIANTTGVALDIKAGMSKLTALSKGRADLIAVNELAIAYFRGVRKGYGQNKQARKRWYVSDQHDIDDICDMNEDDGPIGIDEAFQSGDFEPPAHINCTCLLRLTRSPWPER